jgi:hypothetical protein
MVQLVTKARRLGYALFLFALAGCAGLGGESVNLRTSPIPQSKSQNVGTVSLLKEAEDRRTGDRSEIGKSTWTLFKIKHSGITAKEPLIFDFVRIIKQDLEASGYPVNLVDRSTNSGAPTLKVSVEQFAFEMWSYLWPYVPIDGNITLSLVVQAPDGRNIDSRLISSPGEASCWFGGCSENIEDAIDKSLKAIRLQLNQWFNSEGFQKNWDKT